MKRFSLYLAVAAMLLFAGNAALAQHGHGGGAGGGMGSAHSMGSANHGGPDNPASHGPSNANSPKGQSPSTILSRNTKLASKLQSLLPPGTNLQTAASGFKNLGQFVAAVHVSHNLGIPFDQLKAKMTGTALGSAPASSPMSLGKAIQTLKPAADAKAESKKANKQADQDIKESESES